MGHGHERHGRPDWNVVDGLVIGNFLGVDAMAAYGLASPIFVVIAAIGGVISSGLQTVCAKLLGGGKVEEAKRSFSAMLITGIVSGVQRCCGGTLHSKQYGLAVWFSWDGNRICNAHAGRIILRRRRHHRPK